MILVGLVYLAVDIFFTRYGIWGFNNRYTGKIYPLGLPLEEWLFFFMVPYASMFLHEVLTHYFPGILVGLKTTRVISALIIGGGLLLAVLFSGRAYTIYMSLLIAGAAGAAWFVSLDLMRRYLFTFLVILVPFFIVNSLLTGTYITEEVVWYNNNENLGIRLGTVPVEDLGYAFSLVLFNLSATEVFRLLSGKRH